MKNKQPTKLELEQATKIKTLEEKLGRAERATTILRTQRDAARSAEMRLRGSLVTMVREGTRHLTLVDNAMVDEDDRVMDGQDRP